MTTELNMSISNIRAKINQSIIGDSSHGGEVLTKKLDALTNFKSTPTIISRDLKIQGEIFSAGVIEIEGNITGTLNGNSIILREEGSINGAVFAENFSIRGKFEGTIKAKNISIASKARVNGEIEYDILSVEDGACIDGHFKKK
jgi:cytoskeletal protein CcmA (bactofilin family)